MNRLEVRGFNDHCSMAFRVQVLEHSFGRTHVAKPVEIAFEPHDPGKLHDSTFTWNYDFAQQIFQALWDAGYRPADGSCGSDERTALKKHIDFAELVSKALLDTNIHRLAGDIARSMK